MDVHAYAALKPKAELVPFTYHTPPLGPYDVIVKISHCGLCHSDIHLIDNNWQRSVYPLVPGHEIVGVIKDKGSLVENLQIGQRVGQSWIRSACLQCLECIQGDTNFCLKKTTTCNHNHGGFADFILSDSRFVYLIPDSLDSAHAAPLFCAGATVYAPLRRFMPRTVAIIGVGGLGHLAIQFAHKMGSEVTAISSSHSKEQDAKDFGASHFYTFEHLPLSARFDLIVSTVHVDLDWNSLLTLLKPKGTLCFLGRPPSHGSIDVSPLISFGKSITGSSTASRAWIHEMLAFAADKKIAPLIELTPLSQINEAIVRVKSNRVRYRAVLKIS